MSSWSEQMCGGEQVCKDRSNKNNANGNHAPNLRVDVVDSWHKQWPSVLGAIERQGGRESLMVDDDGWLSARQCLLVAFDREQRMAGHLVFRLQPQARAEVSSRRPSVEARLDSVGIVPGFDDGEVRKLLGEAAQKKARSLRCRKLVGFDAV
jgi:hypothetical protein